ncbi:MAG: CsbD family protein [Pseudomonadota bacterium]
MDKEHIKGTAKKIEGKAKEIAGELVGDKELETEGKLDQVEGEARKMTGDAKDAVR